MHELLCDLNASKTRSTGEPTGICPFFLQYTFVKLCESNSGLFCNLPLNGIQRSTSLKYFKWFAVLQTT